MQGHAEARKVHAKYMPRETVNLRGVSGPCDGHFEAMRWP